MHSRVGIAEYACRAILPNPGMDHPCNVSDEVATLLAALLFSQSVRISQARQRTDIGMAVPVCERFGERRIQWLAIRPFGRFPEIDHADQRVPSGRGGILLIQQDRRLLDVKFLWFQGANEVDTCSREIRTHRLVSIGFSDMYVLILCRCLAGALQLSQGGF